MALFANGTVNTVLGVVNMVADVVIGTKTVVVYSYDAYTGQAEPVKDAKRVYHYSKNKINGFISQPVEVQVLQVSDRMVEGIKDPATFGNIVGLLATGGLGPAASATRTAAGGARELELLGAAAAGKSFTKKQITKLFARFGILPEEQYLGNRKHGLNWSDNDAKFWARGANKGPNAASAQGRWGSIEDLEDAASKAAQLAPGQGEYFPLRTGANSQLFMPDGTVQPATHMFLRNNGNGTFHGYPTIPSEMKGPAAARFRASQQ